jgi:hypothetical protein
MILNDLICISHCLCLCLLICISHNQIGDEGGLISFGTTGYLNDFVYSTAKMQSLNNGIFLCFNWNYSLFNYSLESWAVPAFYFPKLIGKLPKWGSV